MMMGNTTSFGGRARSCLLSAVAAAAADLSPATSASGRPRVQAQELICSRAGSARAWRCAGRSWLRSCWAQRGRPSQRRMARQPAGAAGAALLGLPLRGSSGVGAAAASRPGGRSSSTSISMISPVPTSQRPPR
eukprot:scaffold12240_cov106-Isochrysis_galbana.AAC.2